MHPRAAEAAVEVNDFACTHISLERILRLSQPRPKMPRRVLLPRLPQGFAIRLAVHWMTPTPIFCPAAMGARSGWLVSDLTPSLVAEAFRHADVRS